MIERLLYGALFASAGFWSGYHLALFARVPRDTSKFALIVSASTAIGFVRGVTGKGFLQNWNAY
jgi:hypothetical protein